MTSPKTRAWLMTNGDTSVDWVEPGETQPEPLEGFRAVALVSRADLAAALKLVVRYAERCDDLADHTDDHTCAGLREIAEGLRALAAGEAPACTKMQQP